MNPSIEAIRNLLARNREHDEIVKRCRALLENNSLVVTSVEIPLKNALGIYARRARLNVKTGEQIEGFEDLISNLKRETSVRVGIHSIQAGERWLFVFTTPSMDKLLGILVPRRTETRITAELAIPTTNRFPDQ